MNRTTFMTTASLLVALGSTAASGAPIAFSGAAFTNANQVSTNGTLVQAVNLGHGDVSGGVNTGVATTAVTVNGVTFGSDSGDGTGFFAADSASDFYAAVNFDSAANPIVGLTAANADALLDSIEFGGGVGNSIARLTGLTIGQAYEVQVFVARQARAYDFGHATPSGDATEVYTLAGVASGSIVTGTFTATEAIQDIHIASPDGNIEAGAFQLRAVPEPASLALISLGGAALLLRRRG